jgi:hypothetical protein
VLLEPVFILIRVFLSFPESTHMLACPVITATEYPPITGWMNQVENAVPDINVMSPVVGLNGCGRQQGNQYDQ